MRYNFLQLLRQGFFGHRGWPRTWRRAEPAASYDAVVVGGGGHGLATAWHLVRDEGLSRVAVLERGFDPLPVETVASAAAGLAEALVVAARTRGRT
jgi:glycine/D-amino acid oxidase-like deaminating enzyme